MRRVAYVVFALLIALALLAKAFYPKLDINKERDSITSKVCSQTSLAEARSVLDSLHFDEVIVLEDEKKISAWKEYRRSRWSIPAVVYVRIDASSSLPNCKVEGFYVGR
jgi:hypothetical protein